MCTVSQLFIWPIGTLSVSPTDFVSFYCDCNWNGTAVFDFLLDFMAVWCNTFTIVMIIEICLYHLAIAVYTGIACIMLFIRLSRIDSICWLMFKKSEMLRQQLLLQMLSYTCLSDLSIEDSTQDLSMIHLLEQNYCIDSCKWFMFIYSVCMNMYPKAVINLGVSAFGSAFCEAACHTFSMWMAACIFLPSALQRLVWDHGNGMSL